MTQKADFPMLSCSGSLACMCLYTKCGQLPSVKVSSSALCIKIARPGVFERWQCHRLVFSVCTWVSGHCTCGPVTEETRQGLCWCVRHQPALALAWMHDSRCCHPIGQGVYSMQWTRQRWGSAPQRPHSFTFCRNMACVSVSGKSVKQRSLFLHNLPPSMDENFLKILFPRSLKVGLVKVSDDIRWVCRHHLETPCILLQPGQHHARWCWWAFSSKSKAHCPRPGYCRSPDFGHNCGATVALLAQGKFIFSNCNGLCVRVYMCACVCNMGVSNPLWSECTWMKTGDTAYIYGEKQMHSENLSCIGVNYQFRRAFPIMA